jgi:NADH-quinone oxidoreductase subunit D
VILFGVGAAALAPGVTKVDLPSTHPASHGGIRIHAEVASGAITAADIEIGFMHRSVEKLFEVRDFRQGAMLANRHTWTSPTAGEYAYVLAAEELLGILPSPAALRLRSIFCEVDRTISHLTFLSTIPELSSAGLSAVRHSWMELMEEATGARMHHQVIRIGGVAQGLPPGWSDRALALGEATADAIEMWRQASNSQLQQFTGIGQLSRLAAEGHGVTGPIARASGLDLDLRRDAPYGNYQSISPEVPADSRGDIPARVSLMAEEVLATCDLLQRLLQDHADQAEDELLVRTPKNLRVPEGECYAAVEGALGINGVSLFSTGGLSPDRLRLRTASFGNLSGLAEALVGLPVEALAMMIASWPFLSGDADR